MITKARDQVCFCFVLIFFFFIKEIKEELECFGELLALSEREETEKAN